jgi:SAM-dependent methyltransferase
MRAEEYRAMFDLEDRLWWYTGMRAITASILDPYLSGKHRLNILDVGCGTGYSLAWLKEKFTTENAFGIDYSTEASPFWREHSIETSVLASATNLPFPSNYFNLITCFDVIYQFDTEGARDAITEMHRCLKPEGLLFIREPAYDWMRGSHDEAVATRHRFTRGELRRELSARGFAIERASYANTLLFGAAALHRFLSRVKGETSSDVRPAPDWMNRSFSAVLNLEALWLRRMSFPFGLSVIVLAKK